MLQTLILGNVVVSAIITKLDQARKCGKNMNKSKNYCQICGLLRQRFSNHGSRPKCESPRLHGWVAKPCKLPHVKKKDLRTQHFKSKDSFLREHYDFKTKIKMQDKSKLPLVLFQ